MVELRVFRLVEQDAYTAAIEERQVRAAAKQKPQAEGVAVKRDGAVDVVRANVDRADAFDVHDATIPANASSRFSNRAKFIAALVRAQPRRLFPGKSPR